MTDADLKKILVTALALISLWLWALREERPEDCTYNCTTDISAQRR